MNKIVTSVGLLALGASALHAAENSTLNRLQDTKPWSVQATLRGFYDDNVNTQPSNGIETAGFDVKPSVDFGLPGEQTSFNVGYAFTARFYDKSPQGAGGDKDDYTHTFDLDLAHAFSPRFDVALSESFVIGQEPDLIRDAAATQRIDGDNIRNHAGIDFNLVATQLLGFSFGYNNSFYDYDDESVYPALTPVGIDAANQPSNSGLLDRVEHSVRIDSNWKLTPQTVGIVGYTYSQVNYTGDEVIRGIVGLAGQSMSDSRDSQGHTLYVGARHVFNPSLTGSLQVGGQYYSYDQPGSDSQWSPYVLGSLNYAFQTTTSLEAGVKYSRSPANVGGSSVSTLVLDTETALAYASLRREIISKLIGSVKGTVQKAEYNGGGPGLDGEGFVFYQIGLDLTYEFTRNFAGHIGYNYDDLDSDLLARSYNRNRVYLGMTAGF
jgi:hypothetical protein